jgi:hypothetical protein
MKRSQNRRSIPKRLIAAAAIVIAAGTGGLALDGAIRATDASLPESAASLWAGDGIIHSRFVDGEGKLQSQEWLDQRTGSTRRIEYDAGPKGGVARFTVRNGLRVSKWSSVSPSSRSVYEAVDASDGRFLYTSYLLRPSRMFDTGIAHVEGAGVIDEAATWKVVTRSSNHETPDGFKATIEVDQKTFLPLRYIAEAEGGRAVLNVVSKRLPRTRDGLGLFSVADTWTFRDKRVRLGEVTEAVPFPVYGLATQASHGLVADAPNLQEQKLHAAQGFPIEPELFLTYRRSGSEQAAIEFSEQAAATTDAEFRLAKFKAMGTRASVVISGRRQRVYLLDAKRQPVHFAIVLGNTLVKGYANMPATQVLKMLRSLREIH